ncbi:hypothetical protein [Aurantiacibacter sp. D1-12]|uniref:hypothetical protein n=1 Tax=Aurantiacibacter sp. D1-12 TaxID=2993658 RepID=UPI00237C912E|nr:hypothetical protein [Aurantiacibacter sp. D1-12]MDE1467056.1 hypothetical protein [Aurantiacibacter sp. D1-12]
MSSRRNRSASHRGGALLMLLGVVVAWSAMRLMTWAPPFEPASLSVLPLGGAPLVEDIAPERSAAPSEAEDALPIEQPMIVPPYPSQPIVEPAPPPERVISPQPVVPQPQAEIPMMSSAASRSFGGVGQLINHAMLLQAGYRSSASAPAGLYAETALVRPDAQLQNVPAAAAEMRRDPAPSRWSMDAWALWREDTTTPILSGRPSYGRSQAGAVLRYRLAPSSGHGPHLHLRGNAALEGAREREVAFGVSARTIPSVPVRFAAEARVTEIAGGTELRGAAYAVTEIPPIPLPAGFSAEVYGQAGYVTGDNATLFVDGQTRLTRRLAGNDDFRLEAGGGAWGGAQEDAGRLDVGPSASVNFRIGPARGRVSADYRFRVAGEAEPSSGPALTLSAGF